MTAAIHFTTPLEGGQSQTLQGESGQYADYLDDAFETEA